MCPIVGTWIPNFVDGFLLKGNIGRKKRYNGFPSKKYHRFIIGKNSYK